MIEREKKSIKSRVKEVRDKSNALTNSSANIPVDVLDMIDQLEADVTEEIVKGVIDGRQLLRIADKRAIEIEKILRNYE